MEKRQKSNKGMILSLIFLTIFMVGFAAASSSSFSSSTSSSTSSSSSSSSSYSSSSSWAFVSFTTLCTPCFEKKPVHKTCEDFGFDYSIAKWEWNCGWSPEGNDMGTLVSGNAGLATWFAGSSGADGIIAKAGLGYESMNGTQGIIDKIDGKDLSHIVFCGYDDPVCVPNRVNGTWSSWTEGECVEGWKTDVRTRTESDVNNCEGSSDVTYTETRSEECEIPCVENIVYGDWTSWTNSSECVNDLRTQVRTRVEYDANVCGYFNNVTHEDLRSIPCETPCVPNIIFSCWSDWDESECVDGWIIGTRTRTEYDENSCGTFNDVIHTDTRQTECEIPCVPNRVNETWSDWTEGECVEGWMTETRSRTEYDANSCEGSVNETREETRTITCEIPCVPEIVNESWSEWVNDSICINNLMSQSRTLVEYDANSCEGSVDVTYTDNRDISCEVPCVEDIVFGEWSSWVNSSECVEGIMNQIRTRLEYDANSCGTFNKITHEETREIECGDDPECCEDDQCGTDYTEKYCVGDDVYKKVYDYFCVDGFCGSSVTDVFVEECDDYCSDGICKREKRDGDIRHNSTQFERFEAVNYYGESSASGESEVINLEEGSSEGDINWAKLLPWILIILILLLFLFIIVLF